MKRLAVPAVLAVAMILALVGTASATEDNWRVKLAADDGAGGFPAIGAQLGVYPTSVDGLDAQDGPVCPGLAADVPGTGIHVAAAIPGQTDIYLKNIRYPYSPEWYYRTWDVFIAANVNSPATMIRTRLFTVATTALPPRDHDGWPCIYALRMLDNKGVPGAPHNGTWWDLPTPTSHSTTVPFWTIPVNLPVIKLSANTNEALIAEGYRMQLVQTFPIPEPSSILALGSGLLGLAGVAWRRRKA